MDKIQGASPQMPCALSFGGMENPARKNTVWMVKPPVFDGKSAAICNETGDGLWIY